MSPCREDHGERGYKDGRKKTVLLFVKKQTFAVIVIKAIAMVQRRCRESEIARQAKSRLKVLAISVRTRIEMERQLASKPQIPSNS